MTHKHKEKFVTTATFIDPVLRRRTVEKTVDRLSFNEKTGILEEQLDITSKESSLDEHKGLRATIRDSADKLMGQIRKFTTKESHDVGELHSFDHPEHVVCDSNHNTTTGEKKPDKLFVEQCLERHNEYRSMHGAPDLKWSNECYLSALEHAKHLALTKSLEASMTVDCGESIALKRSTSGLPVSFPSYEAIDGFYAESKNFDWMSMGPVNPRVPHSHFTQLIWKGTTKVGMARAMALDGTAYIVAHYKPIGNVQGQYEENVQPPLGL